MNRGSRKTGMVLGGSFPNSQLVPCSPLQGPVGVPHGPLGPKRAKGESSEPALRGHPRRAPAAAAQQRQTRAGLSRMRKRTHLEPKMAQASQFKASEAVQLFSCRCCRKS